MQLPVVLGVELRPRGLFPIQFGVSIGVIFLYLQVSVVFDFLQGEFFLQQTESTTENHKQ